MPQINIDNSQLEELIEQFAKSTEKDKDTYVRIMEALEKSVVLLPTQVPTNLDEETEKRMKAGQPIKLPKEAQIVPCLFRKETGEQAVPVFTSVKQIPEDKKSPTLLTIPFFGCVAMMMANKENMEAMIVNPFTHGMILPRSVIEVANKRKEALYAQSQKIQVSEEQFRSLSHNQVALKLLPAFLFEQKEEGKQLLQKEQGNLLVRFYQKLYPDKTRNPYTADQFSVMSLNITDSLELIRIDLPDESMRPGMCYRVYAAYRSDIAVMQYYYMEKTAEGGVIGTVLSNGKHEVIINVTDNGSEMETIIELANRG